MVWNRVISASLRIGFGGHRCQAEIQPLRHRARAHSPQSVPTQEFRKNVNILTLCIASGSLAKEYAESRQRRGCFWRLYVTKSIFLEKCLMRRRKQNILLNLLLGTGAYLLYSKRHQLGDIEDLRDRARESYETASRRVGRASDALRGQDHAVVRTATASLMGVGVGLGIGMLLAPATGQKTRADISEKVKDVREKVRDRSSRKPQGASGTYGP